MQRSLVVYADGGSRGNPGVAGYGAVVLDGRTGDLLAERAEPLGLASNNVAEYSGLIAGLEAAAAIDPAAEIEARLDSKLVVEQLSGRWKIKHEDMRRLALQARDVAAGITSAGGSVTYVWVPREKNTVADKLSNVAMDGESVHLDLWRDGADAATTPEAAEDLLAEVDTAAHGSDSAAIVEAVARAMGTSTSRSGSGAVTRLVLVRHGVTSFTEEGRMDGRGGADPALTHAGQAQAERAARSITELLAGSQARVVTSSLARAIQTGATIAAALGVEPQIDIGFDEQSFGDWDGALITDLIASSTPDLMRLRMDTGYARPGGESHDELDARVRAAYKRVVAAGGTTVVVTHRKPIMCVLAHVLDLTPEAAWRLAAAPGSLQAIEVWQDGSASVAFTNRT